MIGAVVAIVLGRSTATDPGTPDARPAIAAPIRAEVRAVGGAAAALDRSTKMPADAFGFYTARDLAGRLYTSNDRGALGRWVAAQNLELLCR